MVYTGAAFPNPATDGHFQIVVGSGADAETMTVTAATTLSGSNNVQWTVTRTNPIAHPITDGVTAANPAVSATQTKITLAGGIGFPTTFPFYMQVGTGSNAEIMEVTGVGPMNKDGTYTYSVVRGQAGTTAVTHDNGVPIVAGNVDANPLNSYFNTAVDNLFQKYLNGAALTLLGSDGKTYTGTVVLNSAGLYVLRFTTTGDSTDYDVYYPFFKDNALLYAGYTPKLAVGAAPGSELRPMWRPFRRRAWFLPATVSLRMTHSARTSARISRRYWATWKTRSFPG